MNSNQKYYQKHKEKYKLKNKAYYDKTKMKLHQLKQLEIALSIIEITMKNNKTN